MGRSRRRNATDDREFERIMSMTDDEVIASVGGVKAAERIAAEMRRIFDKARIEAERRRKTRSST